jgi:hypothetical protein
MKYADLICFSIHTKFSFLFSGDNRSSHLNCGWVEYVQKRGRKNGGKGKRSKIRGEMKK